MLSKDQVKSRALMFGHEASLLSSRKWLLGSIQCECLMVTTLAECKEAMLSGSFDLIILCQTLSVEECTSVSQFASEYCSTTPLLIMFSRHATCIPDQEYVVLDAMAGPAAFVQTTDRMLAHSGEMSAGRTN